MISRRRALLALSFGAGATLATRAQSAASANRREGDWQFFGALDVAFIAAAVDRLIPPDDFAGAAEAGVPVFIDRQLAGPYGAGARIYLQGPIQRGSPQQGYQLGLTPAQLYRASLDALHGVLGDKPLGARSAEEQDAFLKRLEAGELKLGAVPSAVFFETLLANTIEGYFADPMYGGNRDMVGWRMIGFPGAYAAFAGWVDKHGMPFHRPPISIASVPVAHSHGS